MTGFVPSAVGLGEYPRRYDVPALSERRQQAAFRFLAWLCAMTGLLNVAVSGAALAVLPLKATEPVIAVQQHGGIRGAGTPADWVSGSSAYVERMVVEYARARHLLSRDQREMERVWGPRGFLEATESRETIGAFGARHQARMAEMAESIRSGFSQDVLYVDSAEILPGELYRVDFDVVRSNASGKTVSVSQLRAFVETTFDPAAGGTLANPLGFQVAAYSEEPRRG